MHDRSFYYTVTSWYCLVFIKYTDSTTVSLLFISWPNRPAKREQYLWTLHEACFPKLLTNSYIYQYRYDFIHIRGYFSQWHYSKAYAINLQLSIAYWITLGRVYSKAPCTTLAVINLGKNCVQRHLLSSVCNDSDSLCASTDYYCYQCSEL